MVAAFKNTRTGSAYVFLLNSLSFAGVIWVLVNWKRVPLFKSALPSERVAGSIRSGLRYVRYAPNLQASLVRTFTFPFFVSAIWSLLAVVARQDLNQGALGYGILNGSLGLGAVLAATTLPRVRHRLTSDGILTTATLYDVFTLFLLLARIHAPVCHHPHPHPLRLRLDLRHVRPQRQRPTRRPRLGPGPVLSAPTSATPSREAYLPGSFLWGYIAVEHTSTPIALADLLEQACSSPSPSSLASKILQGPVPDFTPYTVEAPRPHPHRTSRSPTTTPIPVSPVPVRVSIDYHIPEENYAELHPAPSTSVRGVRLPRRSHALGHLPRSQPSRAPPTRPSSWNPGSTNLRSRERPHRRRSKDPRQSLGSPPSRRPTQSNPPCSTPKKSLTQ